MLQFYGNKVGLLDIASKTKNVRLLHVYIATKIYNVKLL